MSSTSGTNVREMCTLYLQQPILFVLDRRRSRTRVVTRDHPGPLAPFDSFSPMADGPHEVAEVLLAVARRDGRVATGLP